MVSGRVADRVSHPRGRYEVSLRRSGRRVPPPPVPTGTPVGAAEWLDDRTILVTTYDFRTGHLYAGCLGAGCRAGPGPYPRPDGPSSRPACRRTGGGLAYIADEDGDFRVYVRSWPELRRQKIMVSGSEPVLGGFLASEPIWSSDSRTLYFVQADEIRSVTVLGVRRSSRPRAPQARDREPAISRPGVGPRRVDPPLPRVPVGPDGVPPTASSKWSRTGGGRCWRH